MPATMVLCSVPTSTLSFTSFFDFGTASASSTLATRSSTFMKSSIAMRESVAGAGATAGAAGAERHRRGWGGRRSRLVGRGHGAQVLDSLFNSREQGLDLSQFRSRSERTRRQRCPLLDADAKHPPNPARCIGHHGIDQRRNHAQRVSGMVERPIEFIRLRSILRQRPGFAFDDELVDPADQAPRVLQRETHLETTRSRL